RQNQVRGRGSDRMLKRQWVVLLHWRWTGRHLWLATTPCPGQRVVGDGIFELGADRGGRFGGWEHRGRRGSLLLSEQGGKLPAPRFGPRYRRHRVGAAVE